jgi:hypothetical protein
MPQATVSGAEPEKLPEDFELQPDANGGPSSPRSRLLSNTRPEEFPPTSAELYGCLCHQPVGALPDWAGAGEQR